MHRHMSLRALVVIVLLFEGIGAAETPNRVTILYDSFRNAPSLPAEMRYYGGHPPEILEAGTPWPNGNFVPVSSKTEVAPGLFILPGVSTTPGTLELKELSLAIKSPRGVILILGCSHPGLEHILQEASAIDPHLYILLGGLDRKSTRLNSSHGYISYAVFCLKKKKHECVHTGALC